MSVDSNTPAATLAAEQQCTTRLFELLKTEQAHLIEANIDALTALTEVKSALVTEMAELAGRRYAALAAAGFEAKEAGMQEWLKSPASNDTAVSLWTGMLTTAQAAKELNRTNGLLINKHMAHSQSALNILRGGSSAGGLYGADGQATNGGASRGLGIG